MMKTRVSLFVLVVALFASLAQASDELVLADAATFSTQKAKVEAEMTKGGAYAEIRSEDRDEVRIRMDRIALALANGPDEAPSPARQVDIFNDQEAINQILTRAKEESRLVCSRVRKTGSKFPTNRCVTVAQERREREAAREWSGTLNRGMEKKAN